MDRSERSPGGAPRVGRSARALALLAALAVLGVSGACAGTTGLVLGEVGTVDAAPLDSGALAIIDATAPQADAGCATCVIPVALSGLSLTAQQGGTTTGTPYTDTCPGSEAVIGFEGYLAPPSVGLTLVGGIQALCGEVLFADGEMETISGASTPLRGTSQNSAWTQVCPSGQVVVGFSGSSGAALDQVAFACAPLIASAGEGGESLSIGSADTLIPAGGDGGSPYQVACPPDQIARGSNLRAGEWIDAFGLVCGAPALVPSGDP